MIKPHGSQNVVATGVVTFGGTNAVPVSKVYFRANGTATVLFLNSVTSATRPITGLGTSSGALALVDGKEREYDLSGEGMTSALVTLGTATSVIVEWENG